MMLPSPAPGARSSKRLPSWSLQAAYTSQLTAQADVVLPGAMWTEARRPLPQPGWPTAEVGQSSQRRRLKAGPMQAILDRPGSSVWVTTAASDWKEKLSQRVVCQLPSASASSLMQILVMIRSKLWQNQKFHPIGCAAAPAATCPCWIWTNASSKLLELVDLRSTPITDLKEPDETGVDVGILEGGINNTANEEVAHRMRKRCKILVALGDCAVFGGVPAMRNFFTIEESLRRAYVETESTD